MERLDGGMVATVADDGGGDADPSESRGYKGSRTGWLRETVGSGWALHPEPARR